MVLAIDVKNDLDGIASVTLGDLAGANLTIVVWGQVPAGELPFCVFELAAGWTDFGATRWDNVSATN